MVLVRAGLRLALTSHVCWHVLGIIYRTADDYTEVFVRAHTRLFGLHVRARARHPTGHKVLPKSISLCAR